MIFWFLGGIVMAFGLGAIVGAPYLPVLRKDADRLLDLAEVRAGETILDLGCGDGRLLRAAAKRGLKCVGYEINPFVWLVAIMLCWPYRKRISVHLGNYWTSEWPEVDVIYVFLIDRYMKKLDRALNRRIEKPTRIVSYVFEIPGVEPVHSTNNAWLYRYPNSESQTNT
jgi:hypothetical protein